MSMKQEPLVTVLTPVYNGGAYLADCIERVLKQTYTNWEYFIVNNCSTDDTREIAQRYAQSDKRIQVIDNESLLPIIANHNKAFSLVSAVSKYCKVVSADDWLFPECLERMVALAEAAPSVGVVGSYQLSGAGANPQDWCIKWDQVPFPSTVVSGREICRAHLFGKTYVFGTPTSLLYRSDLIRNDDNFYPNATAEADTSACYKCLTKSDFGFVHQVLSYERDQHERTTSRCRRLNTYVSSQLSDLLEYGNHFLSKEEFEQCLRMRIWNYYHFLALSALAFREREFWVYHRARLKELGHTLNDFRLAKAIIVRFLRLR